jgi:hypothetical protein
VRQTIEAKADERNSLLELETWDRDNLYTLLGYV